MRINLKKQEGSTITQRDRIRHNIGFGVILLTFIHQTNQHLAFMTPFRTLFLGDSYTIGEGVPAEDNYPHRLCAMLRQAKVETDAPQIIATTGHTTAELQQAVKDANPLGPFDLVCLLIGVNNQYRAQDLERYRREFGALLCEAIGFAGGKQDSVIVISIPDWGSTPFALKDYRTSVQIASEISKYNRINRKISREAGCKYTDVFLLSQECIKHPDLLNSDLLHYSPKMYEAWAAEIFKTLQQKAS